MNTPYTTRTGVQIGRLYTRPMPTLDRDGLRLQRALLGDKLPTDWDGLLIAAVMAAAGVALIVWGLI